MKVKRVTRNDVETDGDVEEDRNERGLYLCKTRVSPPAF
jgi:hypothetical protein